MEYLLQHRCTCGEWLSIYHTQSRLVFVDTAALEEGAWMKAGEILPWYPQNACFSSRDFLCLLSVPNTGKALLCTPMQAPLFQQCQPGSQHLWSFQHPHHTHLINDQLQSRFEPAEDNVGINKPQPKSGYSFYNEFSPFIFKISRTLLFTLAIYFIEKIWKRIVFLFCGGWGLYCFYNN